jgi:integrase
MRSSAPWSIEELTRLFGSARTMPGDVAGIPAGDWWTALCLCVFEIEVSAQSLLTVPATAFDPKTSTLAAGMFVYRLGSRTATAIAKLVTADRDRLFPWQRDICQVYYHFRGLLERAGLPSRRADLFERLRATSEQNPEAIDLVDLAADFVPREWPPRHPRRRKDASYRRANSSEGGPTCARIKASPMGFPSDNKKTRPKNRRPDLYLLDAPPGEQTISGFFETVYAPRRFVDCSKNTVVSYRTAVRRLNEFCRCVVLLSRLCDDLVERFLVWLAECGYPPATRKRMRGEILAIARFSFRKRFTDYQPRDVDAIKLPKIEPDAWSVAEVGRLLAVAASTEGTVSGFPARIYWPALLMLIYDTGLRINALMRLRMEDVDLETGWVKARWATQKQRADQVLPIHRDTIALLLQMGDRDRDLLFPFPFKSSEALTSRLRLLLQRAGLPSGKRELFHKLRRTAGTMTAAASDEFAAMRLLGHSSINVTRRYLDRTKLNLPRIVDEMQRPDWKPARLIGVERRITDDSRGRRRERTNETE